MWENERHGGGRELFSLLVAIITMIVMMMMMIIISSSILLFSYFSCKNRMCSSSYLFMNSRPWERKKPTRSFTCWDGSPEVFAESARHRGCPAPKPPKYNCFAQWTCLQHADCHSSEHWDEQWTSSRWDQCCSLSVSMPSKSKSELESLFDIAHKHNEKRCVCRLRTYRHYRKSN